MLYPSLIGQSTAAVERWAYKYLLTICRRLIPYEVPIRIKVLLSGRFIFVTLTYDSFTSHFFPFYHKALLRLAAEQQKKKKQQRKSGQFNSTPLSPGFWKQPWRVAAITSWHLNGKLPNVGRRRKVVPLPVAPGRKQPPPRQKPTRELSQPEASTSQKDCPSLPESLDSLYASIPPTWRPMDKPVDSPATSSPWRAQQKKPEYYERN